MTALMRVESNPITAQRDRTEMIAALRDSIYPGAKDASIEMVLAYCQAGGYDPLTKPVHIVPMWDKAAKTMRDTVMPGIGLYRIIADRSGKYAGQDDAEFGQDMEGWGIRFPQWCKVTVWKMSQAGRVAYSAKVFWMESYSTAGRDSSEPNSMWKKRPYGQLEKCAEAAALRKAFPEVGSIPTAEEMAGKEMQYQHEPIEAQVTPSPSAEKTTATARLKDRLIGTAEKNQPVTPPPDMDPQTGEIIPAQKAASTEPADPIADLLHRINSAATVAELETNRNAVAELKNGLKRRAVSAWTAKKEALIAAGHHAYPAPE